MREIKFRCWIKKEKRMDNVDFINFAAQFTGKWECKPNDLFDVATKRGRLFNLEDVELMQYTGLKDKNGKEIYEGDILALKTHYNDVVFGFVVFNYGAFCLSSRETYYDDELISNLGVEFEVIGNVFENPGLLEENNEK